MKLGKFEIGEEKPPFIIAEMSGNHNKSLETALKIVDAAAECGVQALKLQTYTPDTMTIDCGLPDFQINNQKSLWHGKNLYALYQEAHTPWEWHKAIFERCQKHGIICFSTPFDETAVDFLESLNTPFYKVASFENNDYKLIKKIAQTGKPMIISTGMASLKEMAEVVEWARENGCKDLILLKCTSAYPAAYSEVNLKTIPVMRSALECEIGLSDHTLGIAVPIAAIAMGVRVIEKHFTVSRAEGGVDSAFSLEPSEMRQLVIETRHALEALGKVQFKPTAREIDSLQFRRSIYIVKDVEEGQELTESNIRVIRPGFGLKPKFFEAVLGRKIRCKAVAGTPLSFHLLTT